MFKKFLVLIIPALLFTGCMNNKVDVIKKFKNKVGKLDSYQIKGILEVTNNETTYKYDIDVAYEKDEKYKVKLKNKTNDHEQIILKNQDGVYVLTPSLNKSFKFQSEWPYGNSGSYLYQALINDIENDDNAKVEETKDGYIITSKVNYPNNKDLVNQKIYLDKDVNIKKVEVLDKKGIVKVKMTYDKVKHNKDFDDDYFELSSNIEVKDMDKKEQKTSKLTDVAYPLYIPDNTKLTNQETVSTESGDRTILTFNGDEPFTIIEEVANADDKYNTISVDGDFDFVVDVIGEIGDGQVSFTSNGVSYYAVSNTMDSAKLLEVVNSMSTIPVGK